MHVINTATYTVPKDL